MKVLLVNGSPRHGNTYHALSAAAKALNENGIDTEIFDIGAAAVRDCIGCSKCSELGKCVFDDAANILVEKAREADGFIFGSPVYYAHPSGAVISLLDRAFYSGSSAFAHKPGAAIACARRAGTTASVDVLNKYFTIAQMPVVSSYYWNVGFGAAPGEIEQDAEGISIMYRIGENMAWILKCIELGRDTGVLPPDSSAHPRTNFIR